MSDRQETGDSGLQRRVDELETRLQFLESVVLDIAPEPDTPHGSQTTPSGDTAPSTALASAISPAAVMPAASVAPAGAATRQPARPQPLAPEPLSAQRPASGPSFDIGALEERLAGRALALVGGAALLLGAVFFLSLALSRGWITPEMQVVLGVAGGSAGLIAGGMLLLRGEQIVGHVLTAVGLAVISLSLFAATSLYGLIEPAPALAGALVAAAATTAIAIRSGSQVVAGFGLVAALAAPPIMGAEPDLITVAYMAVVLVGIAVVSLARTWPWLPPVAFVLSLPQLYQWIASEPDAVLAVPALLAYWAMMSAAAGGDALRTGRRQLSFSAVPLFMTVGVSVIGLGFIVLTSDPQRAAFLLVLALSHGLVSVLFTHRRGLLDSFGLLAGAYGVAMATAAVPLLLGASATAVVWTAEAAALATLAGRRAHGPALLAAGVLYALATAHVAYEALLLGPLGMSLDAYIAVGTPASVVVAFAFLALTGGAVLWLVPALAIRFLVVGLLGLAALPVAAVVFEGPARVGAWMLVAVGTVGALRWLPLLPEPRIRWRLGPVLRRLRPVAAELEPGAALAPVLIAILAAGVAVMATTAAALAQYRYPEVPFTDEAGASGLALAAGFVAVGAVAGGRAALRRGLCAAGLTLGIVSLTQLAAPWYLLLWSALAVGAAVLSRFDQAGFVSYRRMSLVSLAVLAALALVHVPPTRLVVGSGGVAPHPLFVSDASVALGSLVIGLGVVAIIGRAHWPSRMARDLAALTGAALLYLLSVGVVDVFAGQAYELGYREFVRLDELTKEAQVALSILWTTVGVLVLGFGLLLRRIELRITGLVVLGLATVKVFVVDLSALDVAYRVVTLMVLGLLLMLSAYGWSRLKPGGSIAPEGRS